MLLALFATAALAAQPAPSPPAAPPSKDVAPVTVSPTPTEAPPADVKLTIGGDLERIGTQDVLIWPVGAKDAGMGGLVTLACLIDVHGLAEWCRIAAEAPAGRGFGKAALALRPVLKIPPKRGPDGEPVDAVMNIQLSYKPGDLQTNLQEQMQRSSASVGGMTPQNAMSYDGNLTANLRGVVAHGSPIEMRRITMLDSRAWAQAPGFEELAAAYPAKGGGVEGYAVAHCKVTSDGALKNCVAAKEIPADHGFGRAAVSLTDRFRVAPEVMAQAPHGAPVEVDVPVRFPPPSQAGDRIVRSPVWLPGYDPETQMQSFPRALARPSSPGARVKCVVGADGALTDCAIELTSPDGIDYDEAAVKYASHLKMTLWSAEAGPVRGGIVHLPVKVGQP